MGSRLSLAAVVQHLGLHHALLQSRPHHQRLKREEEEEEEEGEEGEVVEERKNPFHILTPPLIPPLAPPPAMTANRYSGKTLSKRMMRMNGWNHHLLRLVGSCNSVLDN